MFMSICAISFHCVGVRCHYVAFTLYVRFMYDVTRLMYVATRSMYVATRSMYVATRFLYVAIHVGCTLHSLYIRETHTLVIVVGIEILSPVLIVVLLAI